MEQATLEALRRLARLARVQDKYSELVDDCDSHRIVLIAAAPANDGRRVRCAKAKERCQRLRLLKCGFPRAWIQVRVCAFPAKAKAADWARRRAICSSSRTWAVINTSRAKATTSTSRFRLPCPKPRWGQGLQCRQFRV